MKLKEEEYNSIVTLIRYGFTQKEIEEKTDRGHATIQRIKKSMKDGTGFEGYKEYIKYHYRKKDDEVRTESFAPSEYVKLEDLLSDIRIILEDLNNSLVEFIKIEKGKQVCLNK